jgi:hypothetical protein
MEEEKNVRTALVISRHWDNPHISVTISDQRISLKMDIDDFLRALALDISSPFAVVTRAQLEKKLKEAASNVVEKAKETSRAVV